MTQRIDRKQEPAKWLFVNLGTAITAGAVLMLVVILLGSLVFHVAQWAF